MKMWMALLPPQLPHSAAPMSCWQYALDGQVQAHTFSAAQLAAKAPGGVDVVVPAHMLSWQRLLLPPGVRLQGDSRLLPVLQNLLEDVLLDEPQAVHIALPASAHAGQPCVVAVCALQWLSAWVAALDQAGVKVAKIVPQVPPDVAAQAVWCTGHEHEAWCTSVHDGVPLTTPLEPGAAALHGGAPWCASPGVHAEAQRCCPAQQVQLWQPWEMLQSWQRSSWNLAQHSLASSRGQRWRRKARAVWQQVLQGPAWRSARWGAGALALVMVVGVQAHTWQQRRLLQHKQAQIHAVAQQAFPQLSVIVDAPLQMQRALHGLQQAAGVVAPDDFEALAAAAAGALQTVGAGIEAVEYSGQQLRVRLPAQAQLDLPRLQQALAGSGVRVQVQPSQWLQFEGEAL